MDPDSVVSVTEDEKDSDSPPSLRDPGETQIFLCDPSAEAGRLLNALQAKGFNIVDVPLGLLPNRTKYEVPRLIICDADAHEALRRLEETRSSCSQEILVLLVGHRDGALSRNQALKKLATTSLFRPIDFEAATTKISELVGPPSKKRSHRPRLARAARAPSLVAAARKPYRSDGRKTSSQPRLPTIVQSAESKILEPALGRIASSRPPRTNDPRTAGSSLPPRAELRAISEETAAALDEGRRRVESYPEQAPRPVRLPLMVGASEEEVSREFLDALTEPLDDTEDADLGPPSESLPPEPSVNSTGETHETRVARETKVTQPWKNPTIERPIDDIAWHAADSFSEEERTNPGGRPISNPPSSTFGSSTPPPPLDDLSDLLTSSERPLTRDPILGVTTPPPPTSGRAVTLNQDLDLAPKTSVEPLSFRPETLEHLGARSHRMVSDYPAPPSEPRVTHELMNDPPTSPGVPSSRPESPGRDESQNRERAAIVRLAQAISRRATGALAQQDAGGVRRVILTDGDISTVSSSIETESLTHFLLHRGDYTEEVFSSLSAIPQFGRHAGAALIARGLLQQEDLWPVLRAHAEWVLAEALRSERSAHFETSVPVRLQEEPAVFGGAAGTEIYLESVRRVVSPQSAYRALGEGTRVLGIGSHEALLRESALSSEEQSEILGLVGRPLSTLLTTHAQLFPVLYALVQLDVLSAGGGMDFPPNEKLSERSRQVDDDAFRKRLLARRALVDEGDYFSILGVSRSATRHEIERAHQKLMAEYSEDRLTPRMLHLREDLDMVLSCIEEARLVLIDDVRRLRYRTALDAVPG